MTHRQRPEPRPVTAPTTRRAKGLPTSPSPTPPLTPDMIVRRRLLAVLREGLRGPLTLVTAPAGYGKTVLVRSWAADEDASSVVVSTTLDDDDPSPVDFWASLIEGLRCAGVDVCDVHVSGSTAALDRPMIGRLAQRIAAHGGPVVWVLDCGEFTLPPALGDALHRLMTRSGAGLRLVLLTRTDPPLPLNRYGLNGALTEIRAAELSFTASEASTLMQRAGLQLEPADVDTLRVRTRGWPAGLRFAAMSLAGRGDTREAIREFRGDTQNVAGYLMTEVLAKQPPAIRNFLLRTCLVDELEPGVVEALTGQPSDVRALEFMAHGNTFVEPVLGRPGHFRYQPLFREFLRSQLSFEDPDLAAVLHLEAANWLAQSGQPLAAIRHAVIGQAWSAAAGHFVEGLCYAGLLTGRHRMLETLFAGLPADIGGVEVALTRAALALAALDTRRATPELDAARAQLDEDQSLGSRGCATAMAVLEAVAASLGTEATAALEAAVVAERALELMPAQHQVAHSELVAVASGCKGRALLEIGDLAAAAASLGEGIKAAQDPHLAGLLSELTGLAALVEAMAGHLQRASSMANGLLPPTEGVGADVASVPLAASLALAWARLDEYDLPAAQRILSSRTRMAPSLDATVLLKVEALLHARLWAAREEFDLARAELRAAMPSKDIGSVTTWLDHQLVANQAALCLAQAAPEDATAMVQSVGQCDHLECARVLQQALSDSGRRRATALQPLSPASIARQPLAVQVNTWLLQAEQSIQEGDSTSGEVCLETALRLAAPEHLRRPFLEIPDTILPLLGRSGLTASHRWLETTPSTAAEEAVRGVGVQGQPGATGGLQAAAPIVNPLTKKEREVLGYLAELLTTDEIAKTMFVSVNTVRSHVRSILRKLSVARRNEAVRRAWELNLLPPRDAA